MHTFDSDGIEIAFEDEGAGDPIVLIHGFASNISTNWRDTGWIKFLNDNGFRM